MSLANARKTYTPPLVSSRPSADERRRAPLQGKEGNQPRKTQVTQQIRDHAPREEYRLSSKHKSRMPENKERLQRNPNHESRSIQNVTSQLNPKSRPGPTRLVVAFDIGTTFSGISYHIDGPSRVPEILGVAKQAFRFFLLFYLHDS